MDLTGTPDAPWPTDWPDGPLELDEALALAATLIPLGRATSYGGLAAALGAGGPRQAGRSMSRAPEGTPWWRVVRADGSLPPSLASRGATHWRAEGTPQRLAPRQTFPTTAGTFAWTSPRRGGHPVHRTSCCCGRSGNGSADLQGGGLSRPARLIE